MKTEVELGDELCDYCPLDDCTKGTHWYGSCEGSHCEEAYENYLESMCEWNTLK